MAKIGCKAVNKYELKVTSTTGINEELEKALEKAGNRIQVLEPLKPGATYDVPEDAVYEQAGYMIARKVIRDFTWDWRLLASELCGWLFDGENWWPLWDKLLEAASAKRYDELADPQKRNIAFRQLAKEIVKETANRREQILSSGDYYRYEKKAKKFIMERRRKLFWEFVEKVRPRISTEPIDGWIEVKLDEEVEIPGRYFEDGKSRSVSKIWLEPKRVPKYIVRFTARTEAGEELKFVEPLEWEVEPEDLLCFYYWVEEEIGGDYGPDDWGHPGPVLGRRPSSWKRYKRYPAEVEKLIDKEKTEVVEFPDDVPEVGV